MQQNNKSIFHQSLQTSMSPTACCSAFLQDGLSFYLSSLLLWITCYKLWIYCHHIRFFLLYINIFQPCICDKWSKSLAWLISHPFPETGGSQLLYLWLLTATMVICTARGFPVLISLLGVRCPYIVNRKYVPICKLSKMLKTVF